MSDMSKTIEPNSDQLNADDLLTGPRTITITDVKVREGSDQPVSVFYESDNGKPYKPGKSMRRLMIGVWGTDSQRYVGQSLTLFCDPTVTWGNQAVGGIRISHMSGITKSFSIMLTVTRGRKSEYVVQPLSVEIDDTALIEEGDAAAKRGLDVLQAFWKRLSKIERTRLQSRKEGWKTTAKEYRSDAPPNGQSDDEGDAVGSPSSPNAAQGE